MHCTQPVCGYPQRQETSLLRYQKFLGEDTTLLSKFHAIKQATTGQSC